MKELVDYLQKMGVLRNPNLVRAFLANDRLRYVWATDQDRAYSDIALPIAAGQTISQPYTVAFMLELLDIRPGQRVLDIGFGSGWTTGILAAAAGKDGEVYAMEVNPEVYEFGKENLEKFSFNNMHLFNKSGWEGLPEYAPFDRILVSAVASEVPAALKEQLNERGKMVIPVGTSYSASVTLVEKASAKEYRETQHPGFAFVPLVK